MTATAAELRDFLLAKASLDRALPVSNEIVTAALALFNEAIDERRTNVADSVLARALAARALAQVAAAWFADVVHADRAEALDAVMGIISAPPAEVGEVCWVDPSIIDGQAT